MLGQYFQVLQQPGQRAGHGLGPGAVDDVGALAAAPFHQAFGGQFVQRPLGGDARDPERLGQVELGGDAAAARDVPAEDAVAQQGEHLVVQRSGQVVAQQAVRIVFQQGGQRIGGHLTSLRLT